VHVGLAPTSGIVRRARTRIGVAQSIETCLLLTYLLTYLLLLIITRIGAYPVDARCAVEASHAGGVAFVYVLFTSSSRVTLRTIASVTKNKLWNLSLA